MSRANSRELSRAPLQPTRLPLQRKPRGARPSSRTIDCAPGLRHHSRVDAELLCPACRIPLTELRTGNGVIWRCEKCDGRAVGLQLLRRTFTPESINPLWLHAIHHEGRSARPCPSCKNAMFEVALDNSSGIKVEVCRICEFVWFDAGETQTLHARPLPKPKPQVVLPQEARERLQWRKFSNSPSKRAARISIARHPTNGGNRLQLFSGCRWNLTRP